VFVSVAAILGEHGRACVVGVGGLVREAAIVVEVAHVVVVLAAETSALEATTAWDSIALLVKDVEDRTTLVVWEARERVSRVKAENAMALASTHEDAEGLV
jgi:hypothetical protein